MIRSIALALCLAVLALKSPQLGSAATTQSVVVIDGDSLEIDDTVVDLYGIDAPELGQTCLIGTKRWRCGREAALSLRRMVAFGLVTCAPKESETSGPRWICQSGTRDLGEALLSQGYAVLTSRELPAYVKAMDSAKSSKLGLWRGSFVNPWDWREGKRLPGGPEDVVSVCEIKGAVNASGQRIYYVPTDRSYDSIAIDPERGERFFCSDDDAVIAGWKRFPR